MPVILRLTGSGVNAVGGGGFAQAIGDIHRTLDKRRKE